MNRHLAARLAAFPFRHLVSTLILFGPLLVWTPDSTARTVEYELLVAYQTVNFTGKPVAAMTINGSIPGPTLEFTEGDEAVISVRNGMDVESSIHWHGILLPNREDGVPYLTTPPIPPGTVYQYRFPPIQSGTYWYHSHTGLQEQRGVYGSIVIHAKNAAEETNRDIVLVISDWTDENPNAVMRTLKRGSEYYSLKKGSMPSLWDALQKGALGDVFWNSFGRIPPMDISDVAYDRFLINGRETTDIDAPPGSTIRLRVINAAASTYFYLQMAGQPLRIVSSDGLDVEPVAVERLLIGVAETYDLLVEMPDTGGLFELRATAQDASGFTSAYIGRGIKVEAPGVPKPDLYGMHHEGSASENMGHGSAMNHSGANMGHRSMGSGSRPQPPYDKLRAPASTELDPQRPLREITLTLTGDMERYVWSFDNRILTEADRILVRRGENVRVTFINTTMMHHPLHLHGHFFRVVNSRGEYSPLKHTVDVPPMGTQVIAFYANEDKDWFLHCHLLYHMKGGMARVVHYEGSAVDPDIAEFQKKPGNFLNHDPWYFWGEAAVLTQMTEGQLLLANTRNTLRGAWEADWEEEYDLEATYERYVNRLFSAFAGVEADSEDILGMAGIESLLPLLFEARAYVDRRGEATFQIEKKVHLTSRLGLLAEGLYDTESKWEGSVALEWTLNHYLSLLAKYHSEHGGGAASGSSSETNGGAALFHS